ncbi:MAG: RNA polymerase sigma factor [Acidobacteria bacterium]|nr:RNA polymerase sigma factor [Acidobacteriota bacterium]
MAVALSCGTEAVGAKSHAELPAGKAVTDDRTTYEALIAPIQSRMMRSIWRVLRRSDLAEDALQDALAVIWKKRQRIVRHPNPQALILRICLDVAHDSLRRALRSRRHMDASVPTDTAASAESGAIRAVEQQEITQAVLRAVSRLPRKQAAAVLMRILHEEPFPVIAQALGCSEVTARIHVSRGRARLQKWLARLAPRAGKEAST